MPPHAPKPPPAITSDYRVIKPDVSVSRTALNVEPVEPSLDPQADVMAEILAIPPGR
jgi:hypothetical protein